MCVDTYESIFSKLHSAEEINAEMSLVAVVQLCAQAYSNATSGRCKYNLQGPLVVFLNKFNSEYSCFVEHNNISNFTTENTEQAQIFLLIFEKSLARIIYYTYLTLESV